MWKTKHRVHKAQNFFFSWIHPPFNSMIHLLKPKRKVSKIKWSEPNLYFVCFALFSSVELCWCRLDCGILLTKFDLRGIFVVPCVDGNIEINKNWGASTICTCERLFSDVCDIAISKSNCYSKSNACINTCWTASMAQHQQYVFLLLSLKQTLQPK